MVSTAATNQVTLKFAARPDLVVVISESSFELRQSVVDRKTGIAGLRMNHFPVRLRHIACIAHAREHA
jgi:hypothetical protein